MKIRAVTAGVPVYEALRDDGVMRAGRLIAACASALEETGLEVQTRRLVTPPLNRLVARDGDPVALAREIEARATGAGFSYTALGAIDTLLEGLTTSHRSAPSERWDRGRLTRPGEGTADVHRSFGDEGVPWQVLLEAVPDIIRQTESIFCAATVASHQSGINLAATRACGQLVARVAAQSEDGFGNLRFAALANCPPHIPFFPAAYHDGAPSVTVGVALEAADLVVDAFGGAGSLDEAQRRLCTSLVFSVRQAARAIQHVLSGGEWNGAQTAGTEQPAVRFTGVDLSPAPFPADDRSIAHAFERLGLPAYGSHGTLFVASVLTACLERVWQETRDDLGTAVSGRSGAVGATLAPRRFGFSGLMLPVLEDSVLAERAAAGLFGVDSLLLYSAVCGLGLDTVPLPGDTSPAELGAIILDMAALAVRLDKPLTARLFPVPGKVAGDPVSWDFAFFAPSRVLPVRGLAPAGILAQANAYNALGAG